MNIMIRINKNHWSILFTAILFVGSVIVLASCTKNPKHPNIVLITVDDLGWTDLSCMGSEYYETPNIDNLAEQGIRFTNAYAACAVCSPTRAAIQTGRYPSRIGITNVIVPRFQGGIIEGGKNPIGLREPREGLQCPKNHMFLEHEDITIAEILKPLGYSTCHIGKWHLGTDDWYPDTQGYDHNIGGCDFGQPPAYFDPYRNKKCESIPTLPPRKEGEYLTDREADEAVKFILSNKNKPFFLNLCHYAVHTPIQAKDSLINKYEAKAVTNHKRADYAAMIESVDEATGKIIKCLEEENLINNTFIIITSDNGGLIGPTDNSPLRLGKGFPYEGGIRIPQIFYWPEKFKKGKVFDGAVCSIDILPTIIEAVNAELPDKEIDGISLMPHIAGNEPYANRTLLWHFPHFRLRKIKPYSIIRDGNWKLIKRYTGDPEYELFNLAEDISEGNDLKDKFPEKVTELDNKLQDLLKRTNAKLPVVVKE